MQIRLSAIGSFLARNTRILSTHFGKNRKSVLLTNLHRMLSTQTSADQNVATNTQGLLSIFERNPKRLKRIQFLGRLFKNAGYELRIAGGAVRDILRGVEPHDIDFATTARPEQSLKIVNEHQDLLRIIVTVAGQKHGTVAVKFKETDVDLNKRIKFSQSNDGVEMSKTNQGDIQTGKTANKPEYDAESPFEITTLRCDSITDGRHAKVEFINDWRIDAERRDLTINAMFLTLDEGKLIDYFNGQSDLKEGVVRFVGDADRRIKEDYLRILRFFRFWSRYGKGKQPDSETLKTIQANLVGLDIISGERLWSEMKKILNHYPCDEVVELMLRLRLFEHIGLIDANINDQDKTVKLVLDELRIFQENVKTYHELVADGSISIDTVDKKFNETLPIILFAPVVRSEEMLKNAHERMKFSNLEYDSILYIIEKRGVNPTLEDLKKDIAMIDPTKRRQTKLKLRSSLICTGKFEHINELELWQAPLFPIPGHIVSQEIKSRKLPSHEIKKMIDALKEAWAISDYKLGRDELIQIMKSKLDGS